MQVEELADGSLLFTGGSPGEVVARLTKVSVTIEQYAVHWETPYTPVMRPRRVGLVKWRRLPESTVMNVVEQLIRGARDARLSHYVTCQLCGETKPPEKVGPSPAEQAAKAGAEAAKAGAEAANVCDVRGQPLGHVTLPVILRHGTVIR